MQDDLGNWLTCCIKGCDRVPVGGGMCINHNRLNIKYGSPVASKVRTRLAKMQPPEDRFWPQVRKTDGCWLWEGGKDRNGYGRFNGRLDGVLYKKAHRFIFALTNGDIGPGMSVCHRCDTPACVRPDHLFAGTAADNQADMKAKGRAFIPAGELHHNAVLTEPQVLAILSDARPYSQIAAEYGVSDGNIGSIKQRKSWPHLGQEKGIKAKRISPRRGKSDKITPEIVLAIRASTERGVDLAARYGIRPQNVSEIRHGRSWAHIEGETVTVHSRSGSGHHGAKLDEADIHEIRTSKARGVDLAARFGVTKTTISDIRNRRIWKHIE